MPKICYQWKDFNEVWLEMIDKVNDLIDRYQAQGFDLTLRQIYYQFVAADLFPADRKFTMTDVGPSGTPGRYWFGSIADPGYLARSIWS